MDRHFLEFWGNFLLNAARGQEQVEEMAKWIQQGFSGFEHLKGVFRDYYGLNEESPEDLKAWKKAESDFRKSLKDYLSLFGVVPVDEHLALVKKYEELKDKVVAQEETIRNLRILLEEKGFDQARVISGFQELMVEQGEQFRKLVEGFFESYGRDEE